MVLKPVHALTLLATLFLGSCAPAAVANPRVQVPNRTQLTISQGGQTHTLNIRDWPINLLDATDCANSATLPQKVLTGRMISTEPAIDPQSGQIAIGVILTECADVQQSAVFILDPQPDGYIAYRAQLPGPRPLPDIFSSYGFSSIVALQYWDGHLLVRHGSADGSEAMIMFTPGESPAGVYAGCVQLQPGEGGGGCPRSPSPAANPTTD